MGSYAVFVKKSLQNLSSMNLPPNIKTLNVANNQIVDFVGFAPSPQLESLQLSRNPIASLRGIPPLPKLTSIDLSETPLARTQFYRVALLILFGKSLRVIDGERISGSERQLAASYPPGSDALVRAGWTVTYPPPERADLPRITASLAGRTSRERGSAAPQKAAPMIVKKPRPQSKVMDETIRLQEEEMQKLMADIEKVQRSKSRQK
jgi:hypothetical protein